MPCTAALPTLTGFTTLPKIGMSQDDVCKYTYSYYAELKVFEYELKNNVLPWMKSTTEIACEAKETAIVQATIATNQAAIATNSALETEADKQEVISAKQDVAAMRDFIAGFTNINFVTFLQSGNGHISVVVNDLNVSTPSINSNGHFLINIV